MAEQYVRYKFKAKLHRWQFGELVRETPEGDVRINVSGTERESLGYFDPDEEFDHDFTQANFATAKPHNFERWQLDAVSGKPYRESELVEFQGKWYRPEHLRDEIAEIRKRQS